MNLKFFTLFVALMGVLMTVKAQNVSQRSAYFRAVELEKEKGTYTPPVCLHESEDLGGNLRAINCDINVSYGTAGLVSSDASANNVANANDPACPRFVPTNCGGSERFRVPIAITVFEDATWTGDNYTNGTGFLALSDADIDAKLTEMNNVYGLANIEFYEAVTRQRVTNADMYNFYRSDSDPEDSMDDDPQTAAFDVANIVNVYFVGGIDGDHDCCGVAGYAPYPPSRDYFLMVYRGTFGATFLHEFGHYFGIRHTHHNSSGGIPDTALDNSDCLTTGDRTCDTWPDPNFSSCRDATCVYQVGGASCPSLTIDPASGVDQGGGLSTSLQTNIMNYNSFTGCRSTFSPCQISKIQDVFQGCRNNLIPACSYVSSDFFASPSNQTIDICTGDPIPDFVSNSTCHVWYAQADGGVKDIIGEGTNFNAGTDAGISNASPGTYTFYVGKANDILAGGSCRQAVTLNIQQAVGGAGGSINVADASTTYNFTGPTSAIGPNDLLGWYFTTSDPDGNALTGTTITGTTIDGANQIFQSNNSTNNLNGITIDCAAIGDGTYYLTPFVALGEAPVNCDATQDAVGPIVWSSGRGGAYMPTPVNTTACIPGGLTDVTYSLTIEITSCSTAGDQFWLNLRDGSGTCASVTSAGAPIVTCGVGTTHTFSMADINAVVSGFDPLTDALCVSALNTAAGDSDGLDFIAQLNVEYTGDTAAEIWDANSAPSVTSNLGCLFGTSFMIDCTTFTPVELVSFKGEKEYQSIRLDWQTASEVNSASFEIQRSNDGLHFEAIGSVAAVGTSSTIVNYDFIDRNPLSNLNYYRLKQMDVDGAFAYSNVIQVAFNQEGIVKIVPMPIRKNEFVLHYDSRTNEKIDISIFDLAGRSVHSVQKQVNKGLNEIYFKTETLGLGVYYLQVRKKYLEQTTPLVILE